MSNEVVTIGVCSAILIGFSFVVALVTVRLARSSSWLGPDPSRHFNRGTLTIGMIVAVFLLNIVLDANLTPNTSTNNTRPLFGVLQATFDTLQMMLANKEIVSIKGDGLPDCIVYACNFVEYLIYILAPVSSILTVLDFMTDFMTPIRLRIRSIARDTYVLSPLNQRTIALAESIADEYEQNAEGRTKNASIVFTECKWSSKPALAHQVRGLKALITDQPAEQVLLKLWRRNDIYIVFDAEDVASNVARASAIQRKSETRKCGNGHLSVFTVTSLYGTDTAPLDTNDSHGSQAGIRRIDWTRNLVMGTLDHYPLFLRSFPPPNSDNNEPEAKADYLRWQSRMFDSTYRHVVIVGAGHVGTEFLRLALSYSRIHGIDFSFDVFDNVIDPLHPGHCAAETKLHAIAQELLEKSTLSEDPATKANVSFHLCDAQSPEYMQFVEDHCESISYVFISVGNDTLCAETALRTRESLERGLAQHYATVRDDNQFDPHLRAERAIILTVIDNEDTAESLTAKNRQGRDRQIRAIGLPRDMYTYRQMILGTERPTSFHANSSSASRLHAKYRIFAFARTAEGRRKGMRELPIDWSANFQNVWQQRKQTSTLRAIWLFNNYCALTLARASDDEQSHEWLLRMEHSRWNTYMRAEGYRRARTNEIAYYFDENREDDSPHRSDLAHLHPCLVPFDELPQIDNEVNHLRTAEGLEPNAITFQEKNDKHLRVEKTTL